MKPEDLAKYEREAELDRLERFGPPPKSSSEKIAELRAEVDGLSGRIKEELLAVLRVEIERLISMHEAGSDTSSLSSS